MKQYICRLSSIILFALLTASCNGNGGVTSSDGGATSNNDISSGDDGATSNGHIISGVVGATSNGDIISGVVDAVTGLLTLEWTAPSEREDNTALSLSEIQGYRIFYSKIKGRYLYANSISVSGNGSVQQFTIPIHTIPSGKYFIVMTVIDTDGRVSEYSDPALEVSM